jgi:nucleoside-diphosphate-sugar epimerase
MSDFTDNKLNLANITALVTGASGRIGQRVAAELISAGARVRTVSIPSDPARPNIPAGVEIVEGFVYEKAVVELATAGIDVLVHLAALMGGSPEGLFEVNVRGTYLLLDALAERAPDIKRIVLASSDEVYPALNKLSENVETDDLKPHSFYGVTKQIDEVLGDFYGRAHGLPVTIARFSLTATAEEMSRHDGASGGFFFASGMRNLMVSLGRLDAVKMIDDAIPDLESTLILPYDNDGEPYVFQFCDVRDLAVGLVQLLREPRTIGGTFNFSGPVPADYSVVVPALSARLGVPYISLTLPGERFNIRTDTSRARNTFSYEPSHDPLSIIEELHPVVATGS